MKKCNFSKYSRGELINEKDLINFLKKIKMQLITLMY